ncbi:MAG: hypothetical protein JXA90_06700, partial [Planctomycetes bacterium]|nr:hypothetical protein [Planctomycetota bacterium]
MMHRRLGRLWFFVLCGGLLGPDLAGAKDLDDDFQVLACVSPDRPEDYAATTPSWAPMDEFL